MSGPITVNSDLDAGVLFGRVSVSAEQLRIRFQDGDHADVSVTSGVFLYAVQPPHLKSGHLPTRVEALDSDGKTLATAAVRGG